MINGGKAIERIVAVRRDMEMHCEELKVVNLSVTEDHYEYKALFRLCGDRVCMDIDVNDLSLDSIIEDIRKQFNLNENSSVIRGILMDKIMEASRIETRINEGEDSSSQKNNIKIESGIDSLSTS